MCTFHIFFIDLSVAGHWVPFATTWVNSEDTVLSEISQIAAAAVVESLSRVHLFATLRTIAH